MGNTGQRKILLVVDDEYYLADAAHSGSDVWEYDAVVTRLPFPIQIVGLEDLE